jgi:Adenosine deaminase
LWCSWVSLACVQLPLWVFSASFLYNFILSQLDSTWCICLLRHNLKTIRSLNKDSFVLDGSVNTKYCQLVPHTDHFLRAVKEVGKAGEWDLEGDEGGGLKSTCLKQVGRHFENFGDRRSGDFLTFFFAIFLNLRDFNFPELDITELAGVLVVASLVGIVTRSANGFLTAVMSILNVDGQSGRALASLSSSQISFLQSLPKAELHAHLNGCIPLSCLQDLARKLDGSEDALDTVKKGLAVLQAGVNIDAIGAFFPLFPAIYHITSTPDAISVATSAVLDSFLTSVDGQPPQCTYIELRTTPRETPSMSRRQYLEAVLGEVSKREGAAALIVSIDRRMHPSIAEECVELALLLRSEGKPVVGVDLCGDPHVRSLYFSSYVAPHEYLNEWRTKERGHGRLQIYNATRQASCLRHHCSYC